MKKIKIKVTILVIATLVFSLGGLSLLAYFNARALLITNLEMHISSLTISSGSEVGLWLNAETKEIELMASTPLVTGKDTPAILTYFNTEIQRNPDFEELFISDKQGNFIMNSGKTGTIADRDYFQKAMVSGETVISDPLISRGSGQQSIVVAAPIKNGGQVVGLMGGTVNISDLTKIVTSERVGQIGYAFMVQDDGQLIAQSNPEFKLTYNALKEGNMSLDFHSAIRKMIRGETGVTLSNLNNQDTYIAFAPIPNVKWSLGVVVPETYVTDQLRDLPVYFLVMTLCLGSFLALVLNRWLAVPLTKLAKLTTKLNDNLQETVDDLSYNGPVAEVQSLARNYKTMTMALRDSFKNLETLNANLEGEILERTLAQVSLEKSYEELEAAEEELRSNFDKLQAQEIVLRESERRFRSLLENVELVTGIIDKEGNLTFVNDFALELTGFQRDEVIGLNYFNTFMPNEIHEKVFQTFRKAIENKNTMFHGVYPIQSKSGLIRLVNWNNTLLYNSDGEVYGVASIGEDITERKEFEEKLKYISFRDSLTGLYNRTYFEHSLQLLEKENVVPVGMIVCDVDGLKLVNDTLGHSIGDQLLKLTADLIKHCFREGDQMFRIGGDEFAIILPKSDLPVVERACQRMRKAVEKYNQDHVEFPLSLSVGFAVSGETKPDVKEVFKEADDGMYREKLHRSKSTRSALVYALMKALEARDFITEGHADRLQDVVLSIGEAVGLTERNLADLRLLAQFHDIGKVGIPDRILFKPGRLTKKEFAEMQRHSEIGHRIAQSAPDLLPIADYILRHHEWWNGGGYPLGLKEEEIPTECRILAIADAYDAMTSNRPYRKALKPEQAFQELIRNSGIQFDPNLVPIFIDVIKTSFQNE